MKASRHRHAQGVFVCFVVGCKILKFCWVRAGYCNTFKGNSKSVVSDYYLAGVIDIPLCLQRMRKRTGFSFRLFLS